MKRINNRRRLWLTAFLAAFALLVAACGDGAGDDTGVDSDESTAESSDEDAEDGEAVADEDEDGEDETDSADQAFPDGDIRIIVPFDPGGTTDLSTRALADELGSILGVNVTVENRPGGNALVGMAEVAEADPDGLTLGAMPTAPAAIVHHFRDVPFDNMEDFEYISQYTFFRSGLAINADEEIETFEEFLSVVREDDQIEVAVSGGPDAPQQLVGNMIKSEENIGWFWQQHDGGAAAVTSVLGGNALAAVPGGEMIPFAEAGDMRILVVFNSEPIPGFDDVPTLQELGYDFEAPSFLGLVAPGGTSDEILDILDAAVEEALSQDSFLEVMDNIEMPILYRNRAEALDFVQQLSDDVGRTVDEFDLAE
jgi:tripartite-type tricarboxylate transporter receptor subunit TctC